MQGTTQYEERLIDEKLKLMTNYDDDQRFMAACDLTDIIQRHHSKIAPKLLLRILDALLEHLKSDSIDVHGNAIKCLSKVISKIPLVESKRISEIMISNIKDPNTNSEFRDVYGTCVKTIINDVPVEFVGHIKQLLQYTIQATLGCNSSNSNANKIEQELVDIASSFMKKWPKIVNSTSGFDRVQFIRYLLGNVLARDQVVLKKRSIGCLGIFATGMSKEELGEVLGTKGIVGFLEKQKDAKTTQALQKKKYVLQALAAILKSQNTHMKDEAKNMFVFLIQQIKHMKDQTDVSKVDLVSQALEFSLSGLAALSNAFPAIASQILSKETALLKQLLVFSPSAEIQKIEQAQQMEVEDDEEMFEDDNVNDQSWRVRKGCLALIGTLSSASSSSVLQELATGQELYHTLIQKNSEILESSLKTFQTILLHHSGLTGLFRNLYDRLKVVFRQISNISDRVITEASKILSLVGKAWRNLDKDLLQAYFEVSMQVLQTTKQNTAKIFLIQFLESIVQSPSLDAKILQRISSTVFKVCESSYYKMSVAGFRLLHCILSCQDLPKQLKHEISSVVKSKLLVTDIDQEIRINVVGCAGEFIKSSSPQDSAETEEIVKILADKLAGEVDKKYILSALCCLNPAVQPSQKLEASLNNISVLIANSCLIVGESVTRNKACQALNQTLTLLKNHVSEATAVLILQKSKLLIQEGYFPEYMLPMSLYSPRAFKPSILSHVLKLTNPIKSIAQSLTNIVKSGAISLSDFIEAIRKDLRPQNVESTVQLIRHLGLDVSNYFQQYFSTTFSGAEDDLFGQVCISVLPYLSSQPQFDRYLNLLNNPKLGDKIRLQASASLGVEASKDADKLLPRLLKQVKRESSNNYLVLNSIRHFVQSCHSTSPCLLQLSGQLLGMCQFVDNESSLNLIAESIGTIVSLNPKQTSKLFASPKVTNSQKLALAISFRYFCSALTQDTQKDYLPLLISMLQDPSLSVRSAVLKSLHTITFYCPKLLHNYINDSFLRVLADSLAFNEALVETADYGVSKQKIDKGRPLRIDGFTLLDILLDKVWVGANAIDEARLLDLCLHTLDKDTSVEVLVKRVSTLQKIAGQNRNALLLADKRVVECLNVKTGKLKEFVDKKTEDQTVQKFIRTTISLFISLSDSSELYREACEQVKKIERYALVYNQLIAGKQNT